MRQQDQTIELNDLGQSSPSSTLVGTPSSFQYKEESYFEMESPKKHQGFDEMTISRPDQVTVYPYHVSYKGHQVVMDSIDFQESTRLKFQIALAFVYLIFQGLADQTSGTLLPSFVEYYKVDHSVISYIFITGFSGSLVAATMNDYLHRTLGIYGILSMSCCSWCVCFAIASTRPPLFVLVLGYLFYGFASGASNGVLNIWAGKLKYHNQIMGFMHAFFGIGCMITPVVATHLLESGMQWNHWYYVLISYSMFLLGSTSLIFHPETKWKYQYLVDAGRDEEDDDEEEEEADETDSTTSPVTFSSMIKNKYVWFFSITLFFYLGGESSIGNWVYNYLIIIKDLSPRDSSYITSAYWLSLTIGRMVIGLIIGKFFENDETTVAFAVCVLISIFTSIFTLASSLVIQTICICAIGAFIGPVFPTTIIIALKTLPLNIHALGVGFISSCGSSGAALVPYIIGFVSAMNKGDEDYVEGEGLVYFPIISLVVFGVAMILWGAFYLQTRQVQKKEAHEAFDGINIKYDKIQS